MSDFQRKPLTEEKSWSALLDLYNSVGTKLNMRQLFAEDPNRFSKFRYFKNTTF